MACCQKSTLGPLSFWQMLTQRLTEADHQLLGQDSSPCITQLCSSCKEGASTHVTAVASSLIGAHRVVCVDRPFACHKSSINHTTPHQFLLPLSWLR